MMVRLDQPVQFLPGVGPARAEALARLGVRSVEDLLLHVPRRYFDRSSVVPIRALTPGTVACIRVRLESQHARPMGRGRRTVTATVADDTGTLRVVWFNRWDRSTLQPGNELLLAGPVTAGRGHLEMRQPEVERLDGESGDPVHAGRIVPLYPLTQGVTQKWLRTLVHRALAAVGPQIVEVLPPALATGFPARAAALAAVHFPEQSADPEPARQRLAYEELFFLQLLLAVRRHKGRAVAGIAMDAARGLHTSYIASLPFALTPGQSRVLDEIVADLGSGCWMQRLVHGEVGAGKTVLAAAALFLAAGNGWQGAFMAPTETLAVQHAARLAPAAVALGVRLGVLVGGASERDKEVLRARMASGDVDVVIGTHALVQPDVQWARLGIAVVDEQHRFGVAQRGALQRGEHRPHVLVLSATPIPRSLALALHGDLDISKLDEKPPGRTPVQTRLVPPAKRAAMHAFVRDEIARGAQAYVVLPVIESSPAHELRDATAEFASLGQGPFAGLQMGLLHGRLPAAEKQALWTGFQAGRVQVLVCTSLVEVGLDVARATLMLVHHPERFGLASLHQLRGRVGRGSGASWCFLLPGAEVGDEALARLQRFAAIDDGFRIAELDLEQRGMGDLAGTRQHGEQELRIADLGRDSSLLERAHVDAFEIVRRDPDLVRPEHAAARAVLEARFAARSENAAVG